MAVKQKRVLVVVFDALRPDMVDAATMPNLVEFARRGVRFENSRAAFPTETRVNQAAFVTGCWPARHNIVGNQFVDFETKPAARLNTGDEDMLRRASAVSGRELIGVATLGEILHGHGHSLAVISAGTPGGGRLLHHRAEAVGGMRLALARPDACYPASVASAIADRIGAIPPVAVPSIDWLRYTASAWIEYVEPVTTPTVAVLWLCEPDNSYHMTGIGSAANLDALRAADEEFGRVLAVAESKGIDVVTCSDHGQLAVTGEAIDLATAARDAGISVGTVPSESAEIAIAVDNAGGIYVRDHDDRIVQRVLEWLGEMPWCHSVFTKKPIPGYLSHEQINFDSSRAPDIALSLSNDDNNGPYGLPGTSAHDAGYPIGGGIHGGLNPLELHNWLAFGGPSFAQSIVRRNTVGIVDVLPTLLQLLALPTPTLDGRVLREAFDAKEKEPAERRCEQEFAAGLGGIRRLNYSIVSNSRYLHGVTG